MPIRRFGSTLHFHPSSRPPAASPCLRKAGRWVWPSLRRAQQLGLGLSTFVSVGNKADVSGNDLLQYWEEDEKTAVILLYLESFGNPRRFGRIARRVGRRKPIVAVKSGRSVAGRRAAGSHTAALAASETAVDALFRQAGVIRADTLEEMFDLAAALSNQPLPPGRRVAVVTNAGGPGILCADACEAGGLMLPELPPSHADRAGDLSSRSRQPGQSRGHDRLRQPRTLRPGRQTLLNQKGGRPRRHLRPGRSGRDRGGGVGDRLRRPSSARAGNGSSKAGPGVLLPSVEPARRSPDRLSLAMLSPKPPPACWPKPLPTPNGVVGRPGSLSISSTRTSTQRARFASRPRRSRRLVPGELCWQVLEAMGLPILSGAIARTVLEATATARQIGFPVALKLASRKLVHKTEVGGVVLNLADEEAVRRAFTCIQERMTEIGQLDAMDGVFVQAMAPAGIEIMVGMTSDPLFGPLVAFGLGGINVEILGDICFRLTPLTDHDAAEMVRSIRGYRLLQGHRGRPAADVAALENVLLRVARLIEAVPSISELDLNPIIALPQGCRIADVRIRVEKGREE